MRDLHERLLHLPPAQSGAVRQGHRALAGLIAPDRFKDFTQTESLPFKPGKHRCAAVKVIDPRGNEAMRLHHLG